MWVIVVAILAVLGLRWKLIKEIAKTGNKISKLRRKANLRRYDNYAIGLFWLLTGCRVVIEGASWWSFSFYISLFLLFVWLGNVWHKDDMTWADKKEKALEEETEHMQKRLTDDPDLFFEEMVQTEEQQ